MKAKNLCEIISQNGWAYFQSAYVKIQGHKHLAYALEKGSQKRAGVEPATLAELVGEIKKNYPHVWAGKTYSEYAPEIKKIWVAAWR